MSRNRAAALACAVVLFLDLGALALLPVWIAITLATTLAVLIFLGTVVIPRWWEAHHPPPDPMWAPPVVRDPLLAPGRHRKIETFTIIERQAAPTQGMINTTPMGSL